MKFPLSVLLCYTLWRAFECSSSGRSAVVARYRIKENSSYIIPEPNFNFFSHWQAFEHVQLQASSNLVLLQFLTLSLDSNRRISSLCQTMQTRKSGAYSFQSTLKALNSSRWHITTWTFYIALKVTDMSARGVRKINNLPGVV